MTRSMTFICLWCPRSAECYTFLILPVNNHSHTIFNCHCFEKLWKTWIWTWLNVSFHILISCQAWWINKKRNFYSYYCHFVLIHVSAAKTIIWFLEECQMSGLTPALCSTTYKAAWLAQLASSAKHHERLPKFNKTTREHISRLVMFLVWGFFTCSKCRTHKQLSGRHFLPASWLWMCW